MTGTTIDAQGYRFQFARDLTRAVDPQEIKRSPYKGEVLHLQFTVQGEPGLLDVRFYFKKVHDKAEDSLIHGFTAPLAPKGIFTAFTRRKGAEYQGIVEVPVRMFPVAVTIQAANLSRAC
jgi:hypothetical protein